MSDLEDKVQAEMQAWMQSIHASSSTDAQNILVMYAQEYVIKMEIIIFFRSWVAPPTLRVYLLNMENLLHYMYQQYEMNNNGDVRKAVAESLKHICESLQSNQKGGRVIGTLICYEKDINVDNYSTQ